MEIRSPIIILLEMLGGLILNFIESFDLMYTKLVELFITLGFISGLSPLGFIVAVFIGSFVCFFVIKFVFGSSRTMLFLFIFYLAILVLLSISLVSV